MNAGQLGELGARRLLLAFFATCPVGPAEASYNNDEHIDASLRSSRGDTGKARTV
jgi:hypothetical protein